MSNSDVCKVELYDIRVPCVADKEGEVEEGCGCKELFTTREIGEYILSWRLFETGCKVVLMPGSDWSLTGRFPAHDVGI